jgi:hypothetical protein
MRRRLVFLGLFVAVVVFALLALTGCGNAEKEIESTINGAVDALGSYDIDTYLSHYNGNETLNKEMLNVDLGEAQEYIETVLGRTTAEITNIEVDGKKATAEITVTALDFMAVLKEYQASATEMLSAQVADGTLAIDDVQAAAGELMSEMLKTHDPSLVKPVTIELEKIGGVWKISTDSASDFTEALMASVYQ